MDIAKLGTILGIWAHPDDETWASAGVMAEAIENGQRVVCVTATRGDAGKTANEKRWPQKQLSRIRETEMGNALAVIGVHELRWLSYQDGRLKLVDKEKAITELRKIIDEVKPDTVLTFEPDGITGHDDHRTISAWALAAAKQATCKPKVYGACETEERYNKIGKKCDKLFDIYFNTKQPFTVAEKHADILLRLNRAQAKQKLEALRAHESQTATLFKIPLGKQYLRKLAETEAFIRLK